MTIQTKSQVASDEPQTKKLKTEAMTDATVKFKNIIKTSIKNV